MRVHKAIISMPHPRQITKSIMLQVISWSKKYIVFFFCIQGMPHLQYSSYNSLWTTRVSSAWCTLPFSHEVLVTWSCCCGESFTVEDGVLVWVDESSSEGEQMTLSSHKVGNLSTRKVRITHCLATAWWLSFTVLLFLISTRYLKYIFSTGLEHTVCMYCVYVISFQLLLVELTKLLLHKVGIVRCAV